MSKIHRVTQGEQISSIAETYGFATSDPIWNAPENADLRAMRTERHQLFPQDQVFIPDKKLKTVVIPTGKDHTFLLNSEDLLLRAQVSDIFVDPIVDTQGVLTVDGAEIPVTSDGQGVVQASVPRSSRSATLAIGGYVFSLEIGNLDPADQPSGTWGRLVNLGVWTGDSDDVRDDPELIELATELFQQRQGQEPNGQDDGTLVAQLASAHDQIA